MTKRTAQEAAHRNSFDMSAEESVHPNKVKVVSATTAEMDKLLERIARYSKKAAQQSFASTIWYERMIRAEDESRDLADLVERSGEWYNRMVRAEEEMERLEGLVRMNGSSERIVDVCAAIESPTSKDNTFQAEKDASLTQGYIPTPDPAEVDKKYETSGVLTPQHAMTSVLNQPYESVHRAKEKMRELKNDHFLQKGISSTKNQDSTSKEVHITHSTENQDSTPKEVQVISSTKDYGPTPKCVENQNTFTHESTPSQSKKLGESEPTLTQLAVASTLPLEQNWILLAIHYLNAADLGPQYKNLVKRWIEIEVTTSGTSRGLPTNKRPLEIKAWVTKGKESRFNSKYPKLDKGFAVAFPPKCQEWWQSLQPLRGGAAGETSPYRPQDMKSLEGRGPTSWLLLLVCVKWWGNSIAELEEDDREASKENLGLVVEEMLRMLDHVTIS
ncbi:hypothetical protein E1B28_009834 [Marasmius oreades]|uniref:Uncharacterized protein n=1 Tax=Marasmius oreades TaxID=181124 RepID=A0A9P7RVV5_9AGAR|nr:uncharacterized protein E1B28_009834 [Marasmius oreades]KAG7090744.1 hypothetical protein E1B28_009834 [Marasmius oreades]